MDPVTAESGRVEVVSFSGKTPFPGKPPVSRMSKDANSCFPAAHAISVSPSDETLGVWSRGRMKSQPRSAPTDVGPLVGVQPSGCREVVFCPGQRRTLRSGTDSNLGSGGKRKLELQHSPPVELSVSVVQGYESATMERRRLFVRCPLQTTDRGHAPTSATPCTCHGVRFALRSGASVVSPV